MNVPKIIRNISAVLAASMCVLLIFVFGVMPLLNYSICPVKGSNKHSIYSDGSVAFVREVEPAKLKKGDIAVYYKGKTAVGVKVITTDPTNKLLYAKAANDDTVELKYRRISGKGTSFSIPFLGSYAEWLINGSGLIVSVIIMGITFIVFAISALATRDELLD